jgi:hypothetical protein
MFAAGLSGFAENKKYTWRTVDTVTGDERCAAAGGASRLPELDATSAHAATRSSRCE